PRLPDLTSSPPRRSSDLQPGERRVSLVPESVSRLAGAGLTFAVQSGAGEAAGISDAAYAEAGATIADVVPAGAGIVTRVGRVDLDRKSTRLNSSHVKISY